MAADKDGGWKGSMGFAQFAGGGEEEDSSSEEDESSKAQQLIGRGMGCAHFAGGSVRGSNKLEVFFYGGFYLTFNVSQLMFALCILYND